MSACYANRLVLSFTRLAHRYNITQQEIIKETGLNFSLLENPYVSYYPEQKPVIQLFKLLDESGFYKNDEIKEICNFTDNLVGQQSESTVKNMLLSALMNKANFIDYLDLITKTFKTINKSSELEYKVDGKYTYLIHQNINEERDFITSQGALHAFNQSIKKTTPHIALNPEFLFTQKTIPDPDGFAEHNGSKLSFSQPFSAIKFETKLLKTKNPFFNPMMSPFTENMEKDVFTFFKPKEIIVKRVQHILNTYLGKAPEQISIKQVCQDLHMSSATLQRHLAKEDQTFKNILDELRRKSAISLLQHSDFQISKISDCLGYANVTSFNRAFKRWFTSTPLDFRRGQSGKLQ